MKRAVISLLAGLAACAAPNPSPEPAESAIPSDTTAWSFSEAADALRAASCPDGVERAAPTPLTIKAEPVSLGGEASVAKAAPGLSLVGGWVLTSDDGAFGGLSGLTVDPNGDLLAVSDVGLMIFLPLLKDAPFEPSPEAGFFPLRDAAGGRLSGKRASDAEGVALRDGLALVSFERKHRIEAFDVRACGAAARSALIARLDTAAADFEKAPSENRGAETLALAGDALIAGFEDPQLGGAAVGVVGGTGFTARIPQDPPTLLTGMETVGDTLFTLHRSHIPGIGNTIQIQRHAFRIEDGTLALSESETLAKLPPSLAIDNFEGLAAQESADGTIRLYIVSDNNYSDRQRTLLYAFDVKTAR